MVCSDHMDRLTKVEDRKFGEIAERVWNRARQSRVTHVHPRHYGAADGVRNRAKQLSIIWQHACELNKDSRFKLNLVPTGWVRINKWKRQSRTAYSILYLVTPAGPGGTCFADWYNNQYIYILN